MHVKALHVGNGTDPMLQDGVQANYGLAFWDMQMQGVGLRVGIDLTATASCWHDTIPGRLMRCTIWEKVWGNLQLVQDLDDSLDVLLLVCYENGGRDALVQTTGPEPLTWGLRQKGSTTAHGRVFHLKPGDKVQLDATRCAGRDRPSKRQSLVIEVDATGKVHASKVNS